MFPRIPSLALGLFLLATLPRTVSAQEEECEGYNGWASISANSNPTDTANTNGRVVQFTVTNVAGPTPFCVAYFDLTANATGNITITGVSPSTAYAYPGYFYSVTVDVTYNVGSEGSGTISLERSGYGCDDQCGTSYVTIEGPHGPVISLIDYHEGMRDVSKCIADCFDAVASYSTPAYYSFDQPRSVQFVYRSSLARPMAFVNIGAWDTTATYPTKMSIQLKAEATGTFATFSYGGGATGTEFFFACGSGGGYYACDSTTNRLAVQFDASSLATGAHTYTLIVRSHRPNGSFVETKRKIQILIQNEINSPFGAGWSIAGYQRLYRVGNDSVFITDGTGSMSFFRIVSYPCSSCTYTSPAGDFSAVTLGAGEENAVFFRKSPDGTRVGFHSTGRALWIKDRHGRKLTEFVYNGSNQLVAIKDISGKRDTLVYSSGKISTIQGPDASNYRTTGFGINGSGDLYEINDHVGGKPFQGTYDGLHRLRTRTNRRGSVAGIAYDYASKVKADTAPSITTFHGSNERPVARFAALESGLIPDTALHVGASGSPATPGDSRTLRAKVTSARGFTTSFVLDRFRQAARIEQPMGRVTRTIFDTLGRRLVDSLPEGQGHLIRYTWNGSNLTQEKDSTTGRVINYTYDATYNLLTQRSGDVDSIIVVLTNDKKADSTRRVGGESNPARATYVSSPHWYGQCSAIGPTSPAYWSTCRYVNSSGLRNTDSVLTRRWPNMYPNSPPYYQPAERHQYDVFGQRTRTISPIGDTTWTEYDLIGRVTRKIGPQRDTTSFTYGDSLNVTQIRDPKGQLFKVWRNALGWPDSTYDPAGKATRFTYDSSGNKVTIVNRRGQTIALTYDSLDNVRFRIVGTDTTTYFNDPLGRFTAVRNKESVDTLRFDNAGRPFVEVSCRLLASGGSYQCYRDSSVYNVRNLRTKLMVTAPGLWSTHTAAFAYNVHSQLDTLTNFAAEKTVFSHGGERDDSTSKFVALSNLISTHNRVAYTPWGARAGLTWSDATLSQQIGVAYGFDSTARVARFYHGTLATPDTIRSFVNSAGRLVQYGDTANTWQANACAVGPFGVTCDPAKKTGTTYSGSPISFTYDSVGNRKDSPSLGYVDPGNRLRRLGFIRMDYDFDGNMVRKRTLKPSDTTKVLRTDSLFWNPLGQLDSLHSADSLGNQILRITWGYDGRGRQVRQSRTGAMERYVYDGDTRVFELDSLGARKLYWTFYPGTQTPHSVAFTTPGGADTTLYYVTDILHNTTALLKSQGGAWTLYGQFRYGAYGDSLLATGPGVSISRLRYKGAFYDGYTRLYRMGVRYYDPDVGRFVSEDPLGLAAGINPYTFAASDPTNGYDPTGEFPVLVAAAVWLGVFTAEAMSGASLADALLTASLTTGSLVGGAALSAAIGGAVAQGPFQAAFGKLFALNVNISGGFMLASLGYAGAYGLSGTSMYLGAGGNGLHAWVALTKPPFGLRKLKGGLTIGTATTFTFPRSSGANPSLHEHEFGHSVQFFLLSLIPVSSLPGGPWLPYLGLGAAGTQDYGIGPVWENFASTLGNAFCLWGCAR